MRRIIFIIFILLSIAEVQVLISGCAQIMAPTGGGRDSLPPKLISASPENRSTNFSANHITLNFDEYVHLEDVVQNLLVSPAPDPKNNPYIDSRLRTVTIKLRDTLQPNTTYTIDLGNSIKDINENNAIKNFTYVFSTGATIDSLTFSGKVQVAETGETDSTILVFLYKNLDDSAVIKQKPNYIARVDGKGNFKFQNLAGGEYKVYALKDADRSRTYNNPKTEMFAFADKSIQVSGNTPPVTLYAYLEEKEKEKSKQDKVIEKRLRYASRVPSEKQDVLTGLEIDFTRPLKNFNAEKILLTDTLNNIVKDVKVTTDSSNKKVVVQHTWLQNTDYKLIILKDFATDTLGNSLAKTDTIKFKTKGETDYGIVKLTFLNFDPRKNPVLQFVQNNEVLYSYPLTSERWNAQLFNPGDYEIRVLYDENKNGKWDPGNFALKRQPEKVYSILKKILVSRNFEKEVDNIELPK